MARTGRLARQRKPHALFVRAWVRKLGKAVNEPISPQQRRIDGDAG